MSIPYEGGGSSPTATGTNWWETPTTTTTTTAPPKTTTSSGGGSSGGGGTTYTQATDYDGSVTGIPGAVYQINNSTGAITIISKPAASTGNPLYPGDKNNDGIDDSTGLANGVIKVSTDLSWTGYLYGPTNTPVHPNGAPAGPDPTPPKPPAEKQAPTWTGYGPKGQGTYYLDGPGGTPGTFIGTTVAPPKPSTSSGSSGGGGGSSSSSVTHSGGYNNTTKTIHEGGFTDVQEWGPLRAAAEQARGQLEAELATAKNQLDRELAYLNYDLQMQRLGLDERKFGVDAAETFGRLLSNTDPLAVAGFLHANGGNILNGIAGGGNALSTGALLPAARALSALRGGGFDYTMGGGLSGQGTIGQGETGTTGTGGGTTGTGTGGVAGTTSASTPASPPGTIDPSQLTEHNRKIWELLGKPGTEKAATAPAPVSPPTEEIAVPPPVPPYPVPQGPFDVYGPTFDQINGGPMYFTPEMAKTYNTQMPGTYTGNPGYTVTAPAIGSIWDPTGGGWTAQPGATNTATVPGVASSGTPVPPDTSVLYTAPPNMGSTYGSTPTSYQGGTGTASTNTPTYNPMLEQYIPGYARGTMRGLARDPMMMVGDAMARNPAANGARPEIIVNPTQAPIGVIPYPQARRMMRGIRRFATGTEMYQPTSYDQYGNPIAGSTGTLYDYTNMSGNTPLIDATGYSPPVYQQQDAEVSYTRPATTVATSPTTTSATSPTTPAPSSPSTTSTVTNSRGDVIPYGNDTISTPVLSAPVLRGGDIGGIPGTTTTTTPTTSTTTPAIPTGQGGYGVTPWTPEQLGVTSGDLPYLADVLDLRNQTQIPNVSPLDISWADLAPTLQQLYLSGVQGKYGIPQADLLNEIGRFRLRGLSGSNLALGV